jgi:predicted molibdopterin-dependent oxidoreductase YjgC
MKEIISSCIYCGCGCKLKYLVENNKIIKVLPHDEPVSKGHPCLKGLTIHEVLKDRIEKPLVRESKNKDFDEVDYDYALEYIKEHIEKFEDYLFIGSGEITNEDNYQFQKFARIVCQTNNIDSCARLCHAPTIFAYKKMLGISYNPSYLNDIYKLDLLLLVGTNPKHTYPAMYYRILKSKVKTIYLHHIDDDFDMKVIVNPGTEIFAILSWINYILEYENPKIEGISAFREYVKNFTFDLASEYCGVEKSLLIECAEEILKSKHFGAMHGMGLTQQLEGTENVMALLSLVLIKNGKILSFRGKVNVQGCGEVLVDPWVDPWVIKKLEDFWKVKLPKFRGKTMIEGILIDPVEFCWILPSNPAKSMPNLTKVWENLKKMFLVVSNYTFNKTCEFANVILPSGVLIEREGTIITGERLLRKVNKVIEGPKEEYKIIYDLAKLFKKEKHFKNNWKDIFNEIKTLFNWPEPENYLNKEIKWKLLLPIDIEGATYKTYKNHDYILTSTRLYTQFVSGDLTQKSEKLRGECYVLIHPNDAKKLNLKDGDIIILESKVGSEKVKVKISERTKEKVIIGNFHYDKFLYNKLVPLEYDYETHCPNYKCIPVKIKKINNHNENNNFR